MLQAQPETAGEQPRLFLADLDVYFVDTEQGDTFGRIHDVWLTIRDARLDAWLPADAKAEYVLNHHAGRGARGVWVPSGPDLAYCGLQQLDGPRGPVSALPTTHGWHTLDAVHRYAISYVPHELHDDARWGRWTLSQVL